MIYSYSINGSPMQSCDILDVAYDAIIAAPSFVTRDGWRPQYVIYEHQADGSLCIVDIHDPKE